MFFFDTDDSQLQKVLSELVVDKCRGKGIKDFLIMPIQRIPRYRMMLDDLLRKTDPKHCDKNDLVEAHAQIQSVCEHVEETSDHAQRLEKKMELAARIIFPRDEPTILAEPHRQFLCNCACVVTTSFIVNKHHLLKKVTTFQNNQKSNKNLTKTFSF